MDGDQKIHRAKAKNPPRKPLSAAQIAARSQGGKATAAAKRLAKANRDAEIWDRRQAGQTLREIAEAVGLASPQSVANILARLRRELRTAQLEGEAEGIARTALELAAKGWRVKGANPDMRQRIQPAETESTREYTARPDTRSKPA